MNENNLIKIICGLFIILFTLPSFAQTIENSSDEANYDILNSNGYQNDSINLKYFSEYIKPLTKLYLKSPSRIYFSGAGFINARAVIIIGKFDFPTEWLKKITRGTKITFEKCVFFNEENKIIKTLHKTIVIQ